MEPALRSKAELFSKLFSKLVEKYLIDPDVIDHLKACVKIDESAGKLIGSSALDLLIHLRLNGTFIEENVDGLLKALIECNQTAAILAVKEYIDESGINTAITLSEIELEDGDDEVNDCPDHGEPLELLCNTCNETVCFECAFNKHRGDDHEVINRDDCEEKVQEAMKEVDQKSITLVNTIDSAKVVLDSLDYKGKALQETLTDIYETWLASTKLKRGCVETLLQKQVLKKGRKLELLKGDLQQAEAGLRTREVKLKDAADSLEMATQLRMWIELNKDVAKILEKFQTEKNVLAAYDHLYYSYLPLSKDGRHVDLSFGTVSGSVSLDHETFVMIRDNRNFGEGVSACCMSTVDKEKVYWTRSFAKQSDRFPVVVSQNLFCPVLSHAKVIFACGNMLSAISVANGNINFKMIKVDTLKLDIPEGSYVTAMTPGEATIRLRDSGMLVTVNSSVVIYELDAHLIHTGTLDCRDFVQSISHLASSNEVLGIIDSVANEVVLIGAGKEPNIRGKIKAPQSQIVLVPKLIQWDGNFWGIIFESTSCKADEGPEWRYKSYHLNGKALTANVDKEGICDKNTTVVGLSFFQLTTLVCFSDSKVETFPSNSVTAGVVK